MKAREILKKIMSSKSVTNAALAEKLGITRAALWDRLNTKKAKDIPVSTLAAMLKALDCKVAIVPIGTHLPPDSYDITVGD